MQYLINDSGYQLLRNCKPIRTLLESRVSPQHTGYLYTLGDAGDPNFSEYEKIRFLEVREDAIYYGFMLRDLGQLLDDTRGEVFTEFVKRNGEDRMVMLIPLASRHLLDSDSPTDMEWQLSQWLHAICKFDWYPDASPQLQGEYHVMRGTTSHSEMVLDYPRVLSDSVLSNLKGLSKANEMGVDSVRTLVKLFEINDSLDKNVKTDELEKSLTSNWDIAGKYLIIDNATRRLMVKKDCAWTQVFT